MCYSRDYKAFEEREQKKAQETQAKQERRSGIIERLLHGANKRDKAKEVAPAKETAPAK